MLKQLQNLKQIFQSFELGIASSNIPIYQKVNGRREQSSLALKNEPYSRLKEWV